MSEEFGNQLKIRFGLAPGEPTKTQIDAIVKEIKAQSLRKGEALSADELDSIVSRNTTTMGTYKYGADVNLSLRRELELLSKESKK